MILYRNIKKPLTSTILHLICERWRPFFECRTPMTIGYQTTPKGFSAFICQSSHLIIIYRLFEFHIGSTHLMIHARRRIHSTPPRLKRCRARVHRTWRISARENVARNRLSKIAGFIFSQFDSIYDEKKPMITFILPSEHGCA
jgi:hypothetical protein